MAVRSAESERAHPRERQRFALWPSIEVRRNLEAPRPEGNVRVRFVEMKALRQETVLHRERHLDETRDSSRGLGVPDVRLHGANPESALRIPSGPVPEDRREGMRLDGISEERTG